MTTEAASRQCQRETLMIGEMDDWGVDRARVFVGRTRAFLIPGERAPVGAVQRNYRVCWFDV